MTVEQFLNILEEKDFLPASLLGKLRRQIDASSKEVTAESVAKLLVKKRHLSTFQAKQLLEEATSAPPEAIQDDDLTSEQGLSDQDDISLVPPTTGKDSISLEPMSFDQEVPHGEDQEGEDQESKDEEVEIAPPQSFGSDLGLAPIEDSNISLKKLEPAEDKSSPLAADDDDADDDDQDVTSPTDSDNLEIAPTGDSSFIAPSLQPLGDDSPFDDDDDDDDLETDTPVMEDEIAPLAAEGDSLDDLLGEVSLDDGNGGNAPLAPPSGGLAGRFGPKKDLSPVSLKKSEWDSPLLLIGGGALILLLLVGGAAWFLMNSGSGDQYFEQAEQHYRNGSYSQAITDYETFVANYPGHTSASLARVRLGLAKIRQATERTSDFERSFNVADAVLSEIESEQAFGIAQDELSSLLPDIAEGLVGQATNNPDADATASSLSLAKRALGFVNNSNLVPPSFRPEARVEKIQQMIALAERAMRRDAELQTALKQMEAQIVAGNVPQAFAIRKKLLDSYPDLVTSEQLAAVVQKLSQAELANVQRVDEARSALREEAASSLVAELALGDRRGATAPGAAGRFALVQVRGAVYGLDASSGSLLWRRQVGFDHTVAPVRISSEAGSDTLLVDADRNELVRVATKTGRLIWRFPVGERFASPVVSGSHALVATHSGLLFAIDLESGESTSHLKFSQEFRVAPAPHPDGVYAYQLGQHSSLYTVSVADMEGKGVFYLGHPEGTVSVAPVVAMQNVIVAENLGTSASVLHVLETDADGLPLKLVQQIPLKGHVLTPPIVFRRKVAVVTDLGEFKVFDIAAAGDPNPLTEVAQLVATSDQPMLRYPLVDRGNLWIADTRLAKYEVQFSAGKIATQAIGQTYEGDAFDHPLQLAGDVLIYVRRPQGQAGFTVAAMDVASGRQVWENHIAAEPAGEPEVNATRLEIIMVTASGAVHRLSTAAIEARVHDQPLRDGRGGYLTQRTRLGDGRLAFSAAAGQDRVLIYDPDDQNKPVRWLNVSAKLTAPPCRFGTGLLAPVATGQVLWLDPTTAKPLADPFQPQLRPGQALDWRTADVLESDDEQAVLSDGRTRIYRVGVKELPQPHLTMLAQTSELPADIVSPVAALGQSVYAVDSEGVLRSFQLPDLAPGKTFDLRGQSVWGPRRVGSHVFVTTDQDELLCLDGSQTLVWRRPLPYGPLAGTPLADDGQYVLASSKGDQGVLWSIDALSGEEIAKVEIGQPLATGPVLFGERLIVASYDSTLLVVDKP